MQLFFTIGIITTLFLIIVLFVLSKKSSDKLLFYQKFRNFMDIKVLAGADFINQKILGRKHIHLQKISLKFKMTMLFLLKKIYTILQYIVRFVRRNIITTAKKVHYNEPNEMLQELRKERDRIMHSKR